MIHSKNDLTALTQISKDLKDSMRDYTSSIEQTVVVVSRTKTTRPVRIIPLNNKNTDLREEFADNP